MIPRPIWARLLAARLFERDAGVRRVRAHLAARVGDSSVVEAGCGFGFNAARCPGDYVGLDPDPGVIHVARREQPEKTFLVADPADPEVEPQPRHTALLCLVLHELEQRRPLLQAMTARARERVLVYDYDPQMGMLSQLNLKLWEPASFASWLSYDLAAEMAPLGFRLVHTDAPAPTFRCWEFVRGATAARPPAASQRKRRRARR